MESTLRNISEKCGNSIKLHRELHNGVELLSLIWWTDENGMSLRSKIIYIRHEGMIEIEHLKLHITNPSFETELCKLLQ